MSDRERKLTRFVIPACPGFYVLERAKCGDGHETFKYPVIGWVVDVWNQGEPMNFDDEPFKPEGWPLTVHGMFDGAPILAPDGSVFGLSNRGLSIT